MTGGEVGSKPSGQFLETGAPTRLDRRAIEWLSRRREYLLDELTIPNYLGAGNDRREANALAWVQGLVDAVRKQGGLNGSGPVSRAGSDG